MQPCHTYNFFDGSSSTYQESNFEDNYSNLGDDLNLNIFYGNLSLGRIEERSTIGDSSNINLTSSEIILTPIMEYNDDDDDEQDDHGLHYWSEVEIGEH
jgi:hypothetical protein